MPEVFSIYNCGTSHNRQNLDETVADLARARIEEAPGQRTHHAEVTSKDRHRLTPQT